MPNDSVRIRPLTAACAVAFLFQSFGALPVSAADPDPLITATLNDAVPAATKKNPGDPITYTATVTNAPTSTINGVGVSVDLPTPPGTTIVANSVNISPIAYDDAYSAVGNTQLTVDSSKGLLWNDFDPDSATISVPVASVSRVVGSGTGNTNANPGTLVVDAQGGFVYTPGVGAIGTERFQYTLRDGKNADSVAPGYATFTISQPVWYVKAGATGAKTGRSHEPFDTPQAASLAANGAADIIYVLANASALNGAFTLQDGQELRGQGVALAFNQTNPAFALPSPLITYFPATTPPSLTNTAGNTVTVGGSNKINGVGFGNRSGAAITGNTFGTLTVTSDVIISGTGTALNLTTGTLSATFASLSASSAVTGISLTGVNGNLMLIAGALGTLSGDDVFINGGNVVFSLPTTYTIANTAGRSIQVRNRSGANNVTFPCPITDSGTGILLDNNDGATVSFTGGLALTGSATFSAINGGTVVATQNNSTIVNTINVPNIALNVQNTTIGAAGLTFRSISSGASSNVGISLDNTGSSGGLTITGLDGVDVGNDPDVGSGGTITGKTGADGSNTSGIGIYLNNTSNVSLNGMQLSNFENSAIRGFSVTGFRLTYSTISGTSGNSTGATEGAITFGTSNPSGANGLLGTGASASLIDHVDVSGAIEHTLEFYNQSGSFGLTISNSNIHDNSVAGGSDGILAEMQGTATATININTNTFSNNKSQAIQVAANDSSAVNLTVTGNTVTRGTQGNEGIVLSNGSNGDLTTLVSNNTISGFGGVSIFVGQTPGNATPSSLLQATIQGNIVTTPTTATNHAILGFLTSTLGQVSQARLLIDNNTVTQNSNGGLSGIFVTTPDADRTPNFDVTVTNNNVDVTDGVNGLRGIVVQATRGSGHFDVRGNDVDFPNGNPGVNGLRVRQQTITVVSTVDLARGVSASGTAATVLADNNPAAGGTEVLGTVSVINNGIVQTPGSPPLPLLLAPSPLDAETNFALPETQSHSVAAAVEAPVLAGQSFPAKSDSKLTQAQLDSMVAVARARWETAGLSPAQRAILRNLKLEVADLPGLHLGEAAGQTIRVDSHAGGSGWFADAGAECDTTFGTVKSATRLQADPAAASAGRIDLLTTLMHEMGHAIGLPDTYSLEDRDSIMYGHLTKGERRLPAKDQASSAQAPTGGVPRFLDGPFTMPNGRDLPPGKSIRITYSVTINDPLTVVPIVSQATVTGNFTEVKTDDVQSIGADPILPGLADPTVTLIERPDTTVASLNRTAASPTNATSVTWQIVFANPVGGITAGNFSLATSGLGGSPAITVVAPVGPAPATTWNITATTGSGDGTLGLNLANDGSLDHDVTNQPFTGPVYTLDRTGPGATIVLADSALKIGETSLVTITFTEAASGFDNADLTIPNGTLSTVSTSDNITWTATLTPDASVSDLTNVITLDKTGVTDALANAGTGTATSANYAVDTATATVGIVVADTALTSGETSLVTFTFSEAVSGFTNADLSVTNGNLSAVVSGDNITWTATFTPTAGITDATNLITLDNTGVTDLAGNPGPGSTDSNNYAIDTLRPTASIVVADTALGAGETSLVTITFSEAVNNFTNADLSIANGTLSAVTSGDNITWTATLTPTASVTDATNVITLDNTGVTDVAGNAGTGTTDSNNYAIDSTRPTATLVVADTALGVGETSLVTITFSEAVNGFANADLTIANGTLTAVSSSDGNITWTATLTPTASVTDPTNVITLDNTGVQDAAGNTGTGTADSNNYAIDTARPTATLVVADTELLIGETSLVTITFSEAVNGFDNADLTIDNGTLSNVATGDNITWTATFTPTPNVTDATNVITLDNTGVVDLAGNTGTGTSDSNNYAVTSLSVSIAANAASAAEGTGTGSTAFTFTVSRTGSTTGAVTMNYAVSGAAVNATDFGGSLPTGQFTIPDGQASAVLTINVSNDGVVEPDEAFTVTLSNVSGGYVVSTAAASSTITNDDFEADLAITVTDGVITAVPGTSVTYTITASNSGPHPATSATLADTFPASLTNITWTSAGVGGGAGTASGSGNINDTVNLPVGGSVTYTVNATVSASATGTLANTATISSSVTDPVLGNNSTTDTDTLTPQADLAITVTDGVTTAVPGNSVTYTIIASNAGPSSVTGATVSDIFPASLTATWTAVGAGGGTATASGSGNINDTVNLPVGGSVTYTVTATISASATGTLSNTATLSSSVTDPTPGNNSATDTATLAPQANLAITKTDGVTTATPGNSVTYTITASNAGPSNVVGATVSDTLPASLTATWTAVGAGGGTATASGSGNINDTVNLPVGGSVTYTVTATISASATGTLSNTATVSSSVTDPTPGNNSATDTDTLAPQADLSITKTDGVTTATPGNSVTYTITASNAGPSNVVGATVSDTLPASLTANWTAVGTGGGTATASGLGDINDTVNLPVGGSVTYTVTATISASATGTLSNTAVISSSVTDPTPGNNSATDTDTLTQQADLAITKTDGVTTAVPGNSVTYTITASNAGPSNVTGATVSDTLPGIISGATWTAVGAGGGTATAAGSGDINDTVNLPVGGSVTYTVTAPISAAATGTLSNTATVSSSVTDPTSGNNSATDTDTLSPQVDLAITKTDGVTTATPGGSVTYTITASNSGPSNVVGATLADTLPASLTATWTAVGAGGGTAPASGSGNINALVNLPAGGSVTFTVSATISPAATGTLSNTATITAPVGATDSNPGNNSATDSDTLTPQADLSITKTNGVTTAVPGSSVTYTITASNAGPSDAPGVTVADTFPASLTATWTAVGAGGGTVTASGSGNINTSVNLPAGGSVTFTVTATISPSATGTLSNTATVTAPAGVTDAVPGNNSATDTDTLTPQADLAITKTDGVTTATPGGSVTYTITASNAGPSSVTAATVGDTLPGIISGATWTGVAAGGGTVTAAGAGNINDTVNLPVGASVTYTVTAPILSSATGTLSNTATVSTPAGVTDGTPGNNSATDTDTLVSNADLAITKTDGVTTAVPGTSVTYTITASNAGPSNVTAATVADTLPATISGATWTGIGAGGGTGPASGSGNISASNISLPAGGSFTFTVTAPISSAATGSLTNTATISSSVTDPVPGNNSATDTDTLTPSADLTITKTDGVTTAVPGTSVTYTITASNAGPSSVSAATVADTLPGIITGATWTATGTGGGTVTAAGSGDIDDTVNLPTGASVTFTVTAPISASATGTLSNTATVGSAVTDPVPANNSATDTDTLTPQADLAITITDSPDPVNALGNLTYTITLTSTGPSTAVSPTVSLPLPASTTFVSATAPGTWTTSPLAVGTNGTITFSDVSIASGGSAIFTVVAKVDIGVVNDSTLSATATASTTTTDPVPGNNSATTTTLAKSGADLQISVADSPDPVIAGTELTYTLQLYNNGPLDAENVSISDALPAGTTFVSLGLPSGWSATTPAVGANGTVTITNPLFANAGTATFTLVAKVNSNVASGSVLSDTATVTSTTIDIVPGNNSDTTITDVTTQSDLEVGITGTPATAPKGTNVTYTITLANKGPSDATAPYLYLPIPSQMTFVSVTKPAGWTTTSPPVGGGGTVDFSATSLANGAIASFTVVAKVKTNAANGTVITATAVASATGVDPVPASNVDSTTNAVGTVTITGVQPVTTGIGATTQTGLFDVTVNVTNTTPLPINGFRLHVDYSAYKAAYPSLRLYNSSSAAGASDVYIDYPFPVSVDALVAVKLSFYTSTRTFPSPFKPKLTVEILPTSQVAGTNGSGVQPRLVRLADKNVLLEFPSKVGRWYRVRFSSDMVHWQDCPVPLQAGSTRMQWIDSGPPFTDVPPAQAPSRFYRVNEIAAP